MKAKTRLYVETFWLKSVFKKYGFRFTSVRLERCAGGWLRAVVEWTADKDAYLFKHCVDDGMMFSMDASSLDLKFSNLPKRWKRTGLTIGICKNLASKNARGLDHEVAYFNNLKYGVVVYFCPKNFERKATTLESYEFDEKGEEIVDKTIQP